MPEKFKEEIISYENITYPINVAKWEICRIKDLEKYYVKVYFNKVSNTVKDFSINMNCLSEDGEVISEKTKLAVTNVEKCGTEFVKIFPLEGKADKVEISIANCTTIKPNVFKMQIKGLSIYEIVTYAIAAVAVLFFTFATPFWSGYIPYILAMLLSACALGLSIYWLIKHNNNWIMKIIISIMAVLVIIALYNILATAHLRAIYY